MLLQQVGTTGEVHDYSALMTELKSRKVVVSVAADFMALVLLTAQTGCGYRLRLCAALACRWATAARTHSLRQR